MDPKSCALALGMHLWLGGTHGDGESLCAAVKENAVKGKTLGFSNLI
jgi:hypothetical protein